MRYCALLMVTILCLASSFVGCRKTNDSAVSDRMSDFRLDTLDHGRFYLNSYRGKVVVAVFWATWCAPCKNELLELKTLAESPQYADVVFAAVCTDPENIVDVRSAVETLGISYPVLLDSRAKLLHRLDTNTVPTTLVIDQAGGIRLNRQGFDVSILRQIRETIDLLLTEKDAL